LIAAIISGESGKGTTPMTMLDELCDVCHLNKPIGVASTSMPLSVAYCRTCAELHADPEIVFETMYMGNEDQEVDPEMGDQYLTFKDGKYITFTAWVKWRKQFPPTELPDET
jgi:hypothetical protein